ncbi:MAG: hypothetical protein A2161_09580 [Candidatus Schekmanbacteria bacterium RBG_13_48_7]|uniref:Uncharacterized protein n=1 Tax=Candidatus Schekmanbacteria bacterium RBG_13_48_7 TaxID=1817878 RepID=A0A1F7RNV5_9BACT|nr:MAG: hypothetical protein A2161_09580 [Candidatus Schekmanbacteria bacterium RBG_13_48_7]
MDPELFVSPSSPIGYPAPYWFLVSFKVLGFVLHSIPMSLWYTGLLLALVMYSSKSEMGKFMAVRFVKQLPIIIALGINLGIVPLLFLQVVYYRVFYPATILMAWPWFSIIPLLTIAYYCVYFFSSGFKGNGSSISRLQYKAGWISSIFFIIIGFLFASTYSFMTNIGAWKRLWEKTSVAGAPLGIVHHITDPTLFPRWLLFLGLALTTTAVYLVIDSVFFVSKENENYKRWIQNFAFKIYTAGALWFALMGSWYVFGAWPVELRQKMFHGEFFILTILTGLSVGLPWLLLLIMNKKQISRTFAVLLGTAQFGVIGINAISRQVVQNLELSKYLDVTAESVNTQWSPLILFLVLFVAGLGVIYWMVRQALRESSNPI